MASLFPQKLSYRLTEAEDVIRFLHYWPVAKVCKWLKVRGNRGLTVIGFSSLLLLSTLQLPNLGP
jgi:hypothetical protein